MIPLRIVWILSCCRDAAPRLDLTVITVHTRKAGAFRWRIYAASSGAGQNESSFTSQVKEEWRISRWGFRFISFYLYGYYLRIRFARLFFCAKILVVSVNYDAGHRRNNRINGGKAAFVLQAPERSLYA